MSGDTESVLRKRRLPNMAPYAWLLLPLAAVGALLWVFSESRAPAVAPLEMVRESASGGTVHMAGPPATSGSANAVPVQEGRRQEVLENLRDFHAVYKQAGARMTVLAVDDGAGEVLARRLGEALRQYDLGGVSNADPTAAGASGAGDEPPPAILLFCAERDNRIARELLAALEPYLAGPVSLVWDDALRIDQLRLEIRGVPGFAESGEALFHAEVSAPP